MSVVATGYYRRTEVADNFRMSLTSGLTRPMTYYHPIASPIKCYPLTGRDVPSLALEPLPVHILLICAFP